MVICKNRESYESLVSDTDARFHILNLLLGCLCGYFLCMHNMIEDIRTHYGDALRIRRLSDEEFEKLNNIFNHKIATGSLVEVSGITDRYDAAEFAR